MSKKTPVIVWFRQDLRLRDNPALHHASKTASPVIFLFVWPEEEHGTWDIGSASRWWLHYSLENLNRELQKLNHQLTIRSGAPLVSLLHIIHETQAHAVFWNRCYEPARRIEDTQIQAKLKSMGVEVHSFNGSLLIDPENSFNSSGKPYQVFTPFWKKHLAKAGTRRIFPSPSRITPPSVKPTSVSLDSLKLKPKYDWAGGLREEWNPGEIGAQQRLETFMKSSGRNYDVDRDRPDLNRSSRLSPHLHFGEISPCYIWQKLTRQNNSKRDGLTLPSTRTFLRQLGWRDFSHHVLYHYPHTASHPLRSKFSTVRWNTDDNTLKAWQKGQTGYPFVDAGMRQLWKTGWMHNRVRMVVASFLTKHLLQPWQNGADWFWDTLVDADLANNTMGWQWVAGCGADAAPYFRIFNPVTQGVKFDPQGEYVRRWVPELGKLPSSWIHKPWDAPPLLLKEYGVTLGKTYPFPLVDHDEARHRALSAFKVLQAT